MKCSLVLYLRIKGKMRLIFKLLNVYGVQMEKIIVEESEAKALFEPNKENAYNNGFLHVNSYIRDNPTNLSILKNEKIARVIWEGVTTPKDYTVSLIDKIKLKIPEEIKLPLVGFSMERCKNGFLLSTKFNCSRLSLFLFKRSGFSWLTLNPSCFLSLKQFINWISNVLKVHPKAIKVTSITCALNLPVHPREILCGLDFGRKRALQRYLKNGKTESFYIGKEKSKKHQTIIYDKSTEAKLGYPSTRFEVTHRAIALGIETLEDLYRLKNAEPFRNFKVFAVKFRDVENLKISQVMLGNLISLITLTKYFGFVVAKRKFNQAGNFNRTLKRFVELIPVDWTLDGLFQRGMYLFIEGEA